MNYCKTRHRCAGGIQGECEQPENHLGEHLCGNCFTFFPVGEAPSTIPPQPTSVGFQTPVPGAGRVTDDAAGVGRREVYACAHCSSGEADPSLGKCMWCDCFVCVACWGKGNCPKGPKGHCAHCSYVGAMKKMCTYEDGAGCGNYICDNCSLDNCPRFRCCHDGLQLTRDSADYCAACRGSCHTYCKANCPNKRQPSLPKESTSAMAGPKQHQEAASVAAGENFCTHCGNRLDLDVSFCPNCGAAIHLRAKIAGPGVAVVDPSAQRTQNDHPCFEIKRGTPDGEKVQFEVTSRDLSYLLNCSLMNAPLDTAFIQISSRIAASWIPIGLISDMKDILVTAAGRVIYVPDIQVEEFYLPHEMRVHSDPLWSWLQYNQLKKYFYLEIQVFPIFKPAKYGEIDHEIRGKWATILDDRGVYDVRTVTSMPLSADCVNFRLIEMGFLLREEIHRLEKSNDPKDHNLIRYYTSRLAALHKIKERFAGGPPDHLYCIASCLSNDKLMHTRLADPVASPQAAPGAASRRLREPGALDHFSLESTQTRERTLRLAHAGGLRISKDTPPTAQIRDDLMSRLYTAT
jgi:hypothetical protein